jgi:hypothetical protein
VIRGHNGESFEIGHVFDDPRRLVRIPEKGLKGVDDQFVEVGSEAAAVV